MKIDTHLHTNYSRDCLTSIESLRKTCIKKGMIPCITDHNNIEGALAYKKKYGKNSCIIGEEISTLQGEIIGLYIKNPIAPNLTIQETLRLLKKQDAIIIVQHPFDRLRDSRLKYDINRLDKEFGIDFIEVYNSRTMFEADNIKALEFAEKNKNKHKYLATVGSDAHTAYEVGNSHVIVPHFDITKKSEFMNAFKDRKKIIFETNKSSILVHVITKSVKILKLNRKKIKKTKNNGDKK